MANRLSKIVTRTGDAGTTGLSDGSRVDKNAPRIEVIGTVDELNSHIGFAQGLVPNNEDAMVLREALIFIQHDLFDLGGALSRPGVELLSQEHVDRLDGIFELMNADLPPLKEFILPGGSVAVGAFHVARTVARRAERQLLTAQEVDPHPGAFGLIYLNRLSDVLFVAARTVARLEGKKEVYWEATNSLS